MLGIHLLLVEVGGIELESSAVRQSDVVASPALRKDHPPGSEWPMREGITELNRRSIEMLIPGVQGAGDDVCGIRVQPGASALSFDRAMAIERVAAARAAIDETEIPAVLTARCEAFLVGHADPGREAMERLVASRMPEPTVCSRRRFNEG